MFQSSPGTLKMITVLNLTTPLHEHVKANTCDFHKCFKLKSPRISSTVQIIFYLGPLRSVKIFRVFKTLTFRNVLLRNV